VNIIARVILRRYYKYNEPIVITMEQLNSFINNAGYAKPAKNTRRLRSSQRRTVKRGVHIKTSMVCSPHSIHIKPKHLHDTCYTPAILEQIKNEYNKSHHGKDIIRTKQPTQIWLELDKRLSHCNKEDCWLNQIQDAELRKKIDRYVFAPDQPYEWRKNPTEWLSNYDIFNVLEQYELVHKHFEFIGPTPIDFDTRLTSDNNPYDIGNETKKTEQSTKKCVWNDLCAFSLKEKKREHKTKIGIIFNLDKHDQSGSHWVSLFIDIPRKFLFYFDSAGGKMPKEVRVLIDRFQEQAKELGFHFKEYANKSHAHQYGNTECGMYSLFFIITMLTGQHTPTSKPMSLKQILRLFLRGRIPDKTMEQYRDEYFNV
jgi:hypothetical protein